MVGQPRPALRSFSLTWTLSTRLCFGLVFYAKRRTPHNALTFTFTPLVMLNYTSLWWFILSICFIINHFIFSQLLHPSRICHGLWARLWQIGVWFWSLFPVVPRLRGKICARVIYTFGMLYLLGQFELVWQVNWLVLGCFAEFVKLFLTCMFLQEISCKYSWPRWHSCFTLCMIFIK